MAHFHFRGPVPPQSSVFVGRQAEFRRTRQLCLGPVRSYLALVGGPETGKTSFLYRLQDYLAPQVASVLVNLRMVPGAGPPELFNFLATEIVRQLRSAALTAEANRTSSGSGLERLLNDLPEPGRNVAILVDELAALSQNTLLFLGNVLRAIFSNRLRSDFGRLGRYVFVLAGGEELLNLAITDASPLGEVTEQIWLQDLSLGETKRLMAHGFSGEPLEAWRIHEVAEAAYAQAHGHPYLTQRIGAKLAQYRSEGQEPLNPAWVARARAELLQNDGNLARLAVALEDPALLYATLEMLRCPTPLDSRHVSHNKLRLLGIVRDENGIGRPWNAMYEGVVRQMAGDSEAARRASAVQLLTPRVTVRLLTSVIPTAFCHNLSAEDFPLVEIQIENREAHAEPAQVHAQAFVEGFSDAAVASLKVAPGDDASMRLLPVLQQGTCGRLTEIRPATLRVTVRQFGNGSELLLHDHTYAIRLHAYDTALLGIRTPEGKVVDLTDYLCAFVTPHALEVEDLLRRALEHHPERCISGYQGAKTIREARRIIREQVRAVYTALKTDAGLAYVNSPLNFGKQEGQITQRVRLPSTSLHENLSRANCIDGTVLYASLLELADLQPMIVIVPGHAFVGWRIWRDVDQYDFLETTLTGVDHFENALRLGTQQYRQARSNGFFGRELFDPKGFARLIDVSACRAKQIYPLV